MNEHTVPVFKYMLVLCQFLWSVLCLDSICLHVFEEHFYFFLKSKTFLSKSRYTRYTPEYQWCLQLLITWMQHFWEFWDYLSSSCAKKWTPLTFSLFLYITSFLCVFQCWLWYICFEVHGVMGQKHRSHAHDWPIWYPQHTGEACSWFVI